MSGLVRAVPGETGSQTGTPSRDRPGDPPGDRPPGRSSAGRRRTGRVSSTVVTLGVVSFLTDVSSEAVAAILPLYVTAALGMSIVAYGVVDGLVQGAGALVRVAGGWAADRTDRPKWVAAVGYGLSALTRVGLLFAAGLPAVAGLVVTDRIGKGIRTAPRDALIAASANPRNLGRSFGVHRALDTAGAALGPLLAFAVLWAVPDGWTTVFVISLGAAVLGVGALVLLVPDLRPRQAAWLRTHRTRESRGLPKCKGCTCDAAGGLQPAGRPFSWAFLRGGATVRLLLVAGVLGLLTVGDGFVYLALQDRDGFATHWFPLLFVGTNVVYMLLAAPVGRLADRVGRGHVLVWGHVLLAGAYACAAAPFPGAATTLAALVLLGTFYAMTDGVLAALTSALVPTSVRATAIGTAQTVTAVARMIASAGFGVLWYASGRVDALWIVAAALVVAVPVCAYLVRGGRLAPDDALTRETSA
ncbi:sugar phosphate permease [Promicromonospora sp. AC04]|nr:MFS transporter [Promicromonospora sp. AC04]PUB22244.1 sugar phosphate permease [Promicromonospora sp. AC04]